LYAAGNPVLLCGRTAYPQIELRPDDADPIVVPGPVRTDPGEIAGPVDVVVLAVKATQNDDARGWLAALCDGRTVVAVLRNGVEQIEQVQPYCPSSTVVPGIVWYSAETQPEGWVRLRGAAHLVLPAGPRPATMRADGPRRSRTIQPPRKRPPNCCEAPAVWSTATPTSPRRLGGNCW
jgi:2-dehydropantoate 2-reductase